MIFLLRVKTTKREGWVRRDVKDPESVADHMYRMGLMALIASDIPGVDRDRLGFFFTFSCLFSSHFFLLFFEIFFFRCIKMAIVHDIAEGENRFLFSFVCFCFWCFCLDDGNFRPKKQFFNALYRCSVLSLVIHQFSLIIY